MMTPGRGTTPAGGSGNSSETACTAAAIATFLGFGRTAVSAGAGGEHAAIEDSKMPANAAFRRKIDFDRFIGATRGSPSNNILHLFVSNLLHPCVMTRTSLSIEDRLTRRRRYTNVEPNVNRNEFLEFDLRYDVTRRTLPSVEIAISRSVIFRLSSYGNPIRPRDKNNLKWQTEPEGP